jgi:hypothetical protein
MTGWHVVIVGVAIVVVGLLSWETACLQRQQAQQARAGQRQDATGVA